MRSRLLRGFIAAVSSWTVLLAIFCLAKRNHYDYFDVGFFLYGLRHVTMISTVVGGLLAIQNWIKNIILAGAAGIGVGLLLAGGYLVVLS